MGFPKSYVTEVNFNDHRFASDASVVTDSVTLAAGQVLSEGSVLGKVTATGEYVLSAKAAVDGSQIPRFLLIEDTDASDGPKTPGVYARGNFVSTFLKYGLGHNYSTVKEALRDVGLDISLPAY